MTKHRISCQLKMVTQFCRMQKQNQRCMPDNSLVTIEVIMIHYSYHKSHAYRLRMLNMIPFLIML